MMRFHDRADAGRQLAARLRDYADRDDVVVLALPRGGVPVGNEVAARLHAPLDVFLVRKLGVPGHPELAMGAIAAGGIQTLNEDVIQELGISAALIQQAATRERLELERRDALYRKGRPFPIVRDRTVILVDDGLATGATMEAAVRALRQQAPATIVVASPVGAIDTSERLRRLADDVVCLATPHPLRAVGLWYEDFSETTDEDITRVLTAASSSRVPSTPPRQDDLVAFVRAHVGALRGHPAQYDALINGVGDARVVLLGEATHGTHEFYRERAYITRRLILEKGFAAVAVEADWPDTYRVNRYVRGTSGDEEAIEALTNFARFPTWMWRNADVLDFAGWLRAYNETQPAHKRAGFYGLDLYSLRASMQAVLAYLDKIDPEAASRARGRYACFDRFGEEPQDYGYADGFGLHPSCEREVVAQLVELHRQRAAYAARDGRVAADDFFYAEQNARLVKSAEEYYRTMFKGRAESWNLRDRHMVDTLQELLRFLDQDRPVSRIVVWAHNSHLGDARATDMAARGELNVGQFVREKYGSGATLVGFTTYTGTVTAASEWGGPAHRMQVRPALPGSYEHLFHDVHIPRFLVPILTDRELASALMDSRLERAIGVLYLPESERASYYFRARLAQQFDFVLHFDETRAVEPLERDVLWDAGEVAETFPTGL